MLKKILPRVAIDESDQIIRPEGTRRDGLDLQTVAARHCLIRRVQQDTLGPAAERPERDRQNYNPGAG
jgi:hypothetical protein